MNHIAMKNPIATSAAAAFSADCLRREVCLAWLAGQLHPAGARCPGCGVAVADRQLERWQSFGRLQCPECGKFYTAVTGTWMSGAKLKPNQIFVLAALVAMDVDAPLIAAAIGVSEVTVRLWIEKFKTLEAVS